MVHVHVCIDRKVSGDSNLTAFQLLSVFLFIYLFKRRKKIKFFILRPPPPLVLACTLSDF